MRLFIVFFFLLSAASAQTSFQPNLQVEYDMQLNYSNSPEQEARLFLSNQTALFTYKNKQANEDNELTKSKDGSNYSFSIIKDNLNSIYTDLKQKVILTSQGNDDESDFLIEEDLTFPKWEIDYETTKKIDQFNCIKATTHFRGRDYTAWFTEEYPVQFGPWKLHGLPGLIIQAYDQTKEVYFGVEKITKNPSEVELVDLEARERITREENRERIQSKLNDLKRKIKSSGEKGVEMEVSSVKIRGIEIDEE
ncbi:MAG: GLPGLI family protein [Bacteroidota bacterium]